MIKAVIFDLDGTLADTMDDLRTAMNAMLRELGFPERSKEDLYRFINKGARKFVGQSLPDGSVETYDDPLVDKALKIYGGYYEKCCLDQTRIFEGLDREMEILNANGLKLGVLSNKQDAFVKKTVAKLYKEGTFVSVAGQSSLPEKPDPAPVFAVCREMGVDPSECVFVGDSDIDMKTGINSGMIPVGVLWGYRSRECLEAAGGKVFVEKVSDLAKVLMSL